MTYYEIKQEETRQKAQALQVYQGAISWGELVEQAAQLEQAAKKYGLLKEFRREGII